MTRQAKTTDSLIQEYREESVKPAVIIMVVAVLLIALPFGWSIHKIGEEGFRAADISKFNALAALVDGNVSSIRKILANDVVDENTLSGAVAAPVVTLITPNVNPTNLDEAANNNAKSLNIKMNAIYWSPRDPLVTIDNENYRIGDKVQGFTIKEIRKTEVVFRSPLGETVVKYFYNDFGTPKKK